MEWFWDVFIEPILARLRPANIVEIGAEEGRTTRLLLEFCHRHGGVVHSIDPMPRFNPATLEQECGGRLVLHRGLSLDVLPTLDRFDIAFVDGDHNWYTVYHELKVIESRSKELGQPFPVVLLHDVGWPYGRRDLYYNPDVIPPQYRHPYAKKGIIAGVSELQEQGGENRHYWNADHEQGPRNGVLTAVEDFFKEARHRLELVTVPGMFGFALFFRSDLQATNAELVKFLRSLELPRVMKQYVGLFEALRFDLEGRLKKAETALKS